MHGPLTAPGLYLRSVETPAAGPLESGIAGFVGIAERGPLNSPQPLGGWSEYVDTFGGFVGFGYLADSVFGFFRNGGEKCWVVRTADTSLAGVAAPPGQCSRVEPLAAAAETLLDHNASATVRVHAADPGGWGNSVTVSVLTSAARPIRVGVLAQATTAAATQLLLDDIVDLRPGTTIHVTEPDGVSGGLPLVIDPGPGALNAALRRVELSGAVGRVLPIGSVVYAAGFRIEAEFRGRREVFDRLSLRTDHDRYVRHVVNGAEELADYGERRRRGHSSLIRIEHIPAGPARFRPADGIYALKGGGDGFTQAHGTFTTAASAPIVTLVARAERGSAGNGLEVIARPFATVTALPAPDSSGNRDRITVADASGFRSGETVRLGPLGQPPVETAAPSGIVPAAQLLELPADLAQPHPVGQTVAVADRMTLEVRRAAGREPTEVVRNVSGNPVTGPRFIRNALATDSLYLCADTPPAAFTTVLEPGNDFAAITLSGGTDPGDIDARHYTGYNDDGSHFHPPALPPGSLVGLAALENVDEVSMVAVPDLVRVPVASLVAAQTSVLRHCARLGDRFALLDPPLESSGLTADAWSTALGDPALRRFGAAFHPWIHAAADGVRRAIPPSGLVAGLYAGSDRRRGVNKAPANERLLGAFALASPVDRGRHGALNALGVNCIVKLEEGELRLMGARTLSDDRATRHVNIRRTVLSVKRTLARRMLWAVFEPVDASLYQRIESTLNTYLESLLAKGVTASQKTGDAFYVRCSEATNPQAQVRAGTVVAEIGIALLAPAEFIVLTARRTPDAVHLIEEEV